ncbi:MAG TPA: hypothetical protein PKK12_04750, partial [Candidatus Aminicenantes bacterium]|nr:hypothetical protein [Candidatus Aminicenantes bacterium]
CHVFGETGLVVPQTEQLPLLRHSRLMYLLNGLREQEKAAPVRLAQWQKELRLVGTNVAALELRWPDLLSRLDHMEYFDILYNTASAQIDLGNVGVAKSLFTAIAELLREQNPELAGKALYKLAMLAEGERNDLLDSCLNAYPEHGAARARRHGTAGA